MVNIKKDKKLTVRVCEDEYIAIKLKADLSGMSMPRFLVEKGKIAMLKVILMQKRNLKKKKNN
ncbi:MAG: hypothetical protein E6175_08180 [Anaerococcus sp.]|nr:hypothetical protein [Anaerococcus sp.]